MIVGGWKTTAQGHRLKTERREIREWWIDVEPKCGEHSLDSGESQIYCIVGEVHIVPEGV